MVEDSESEEEELVSVADGRMVGGGPGYQTTEGSCKSEEELEELEELEEDLEEEQDEDSEAELSSPRRRPYSVYLDNEATEAR